MMLRPSGKRTRQTVTLTGLEHRAERDGNERLVCHIQGHPGLLAIWGTAGGDMRHIHAIEARPAAARYPVTIECDWIEPHEAQRERFGHQFWIWEDDHLRILR